MLFCFCTVLFSPMGQGVERSREGIVVNTSLLSFSHCSFSHPVLPNSLSSFAKATFNKSKFPSLNIGKGVGECKCEGLARRAS